MGKRTPSPPPAPDYAGAARQQGEANVEAARIGAALNRVDQTTPWGSLTYSRDPSRGPDAWDQRLTLSPGQQRLLDNQTSGQIVLGNTALQGLGRVQSTMGTGFNPTLPARVSSVQGGGPYEMYSGADNYGAQRQSVEDAMYRRATARLDPQYAQRQDQLRTQLINQGVREGSEAYRNAMDDFTRERTAEYGDARDRAILAGGDEQSRMLSDVLSAKGFNNANRQQMLADAISRGSFQNQQRGAALDEAAYRRQVPLNEYNALMSGSQIQNPGFGHVAQVQGPNAAPVFAGAQAAGQSAIDLYNQQAAGANAANAGFMGLAGTLGGSAMMAW